MSWQPSTTWPIKDDEPAHATTTKRQEADRDRIIRESRTRYREFIDTISHASDKDIERALHRRAS